MDDEERALRRVWQSTGAVADGQAYLQARLRSGLPRARLELAALLGEPAAAGALASGPRATLERGSGLPPSPPEEARAWLEERVEADAWPGGHDPAALEGARQLAAWAEALVPGAALRAALAGLRVAVERCGGEGLQLAALDAAEAFVACPCSPHAARLLDAEVALAAPPSRVLDRPWYARSAACRAVAAVVEGGRARTHHDTNRALCVALGRDDDEARSAGVRLAAYRVEVAAVAAALLPWALEADPLLARHGPLEAERVPIDPPARDGGACEVVECPFKWPDDPFDAVPETGVEVRRAGVVWRGATHLLTSSMRRLRFQVQAGLARPVVARLDGVIVPLPLPQGTQAEQLVAIEEAIAAHEAWRRLHCSGAGPSRVLAGATLRLDGLRLLVDVGGVTHPVPVGPLQKGLSSPASSPWDSGVSTWTELGLYLGVDGRLWVERVEWEDIHLAGRWPGERRWFASTDGVAWVPATAPAEAGRPLHRVST